MRNRLPEDADPPTIFKFDSNQLPVAQIGIEGDYDPVTLREIAQNEIGAPLRARGRRGRSHGERRRSARDPRRPVEGKGHGPEPVGEPGRQALRSENQNTPLGEIYQGDATFLVRSQGQFQSIEDIKNIVVMTRQACARLPARPRRGHGHDRTEALLHAHQREARASSSRSRSNRARTRSPSPTRCAEVERVNREVPGIKMIVTQDNSVFIQRAINNVQEHAVVGGILVVLIIFAFLRDIRSTLIVCTSIPVSVIGTFALLYFGGFTLNTMTFGGLALGIGMIVDAAIVVLENTHRHLHMGKDKMTAAIEGSEEVWSAILASTLTHIAVFIPLLFLSGTASIMFTQLSVS